MSNDLTTLWLMGVSAWLGLTLYGCVLQSNAPRIMHAAGCGAFIWIITLLYMRILGMVHIPVSHLVPAAIIAMTMNFVVVYLWETRAPEYDRLQRDRKVMRCAKKLARSCERLAKKASRSRRMKS